MVPLWPFFKGLIDSGMTEASAEEVELDVCESALDCMVRYLYGQSLDLTNDEAARLLVAAQLYNLPELLKLAERKVLSGRMDVKEAIIAWIFAYEAKNSKIRFHCAELLYVRMGECDDFAQQLDGLSKQELQYLMHDFALISKGYPRDYLPRPKLAGSDVYLPGLTYPYLD